MQTELKYNGYTAQPSDYECKDGDLAAVVNLMPEKGSLRPVSGPKKVVSFSGDVLYVHQTNKFKHFIGISRVSDVMDWIEESDENTYHQISKSFSNSSIIQITSIGNTLCVLTTNGMHYLLWKDDDYKNLGSTMPELDISFGLQGEMVRTDSFSISFDSISEGSIFNEFSDTNKTKITNQVLAKVNKFIADESTNKGRFIYPFLVRYAYRLYDGTLTRHSAPVLMICSSDLAPQVFYEHITGKGSYTNATLRVVSMCHKLDYAVVSSSQLSSLLNWSDIITSVDFFISAPIYTYDQNGECTQFVKVDDSDCYCVCKHTNQAASTSTYPLRYQKHKFSKLYAFTYDPKNFSYPAGRLMLPSKSEEEVKQAIRDCSSFYLLTSVKLNDLKTSRTIIEVAEDYLQSLLTREAMTDDYDSHDKLLPEYAFPYNSRLNIANLQKQLYGGPSAATLFNYTNGLIKRYSDASPTAWDDFRYTAVVYYYIKQDGRDIVVYGGSSQFGYETPFLFLYYPNINAYKAVLVLSNYFSYCYEVQLTKHDFLNGSFYFGGWKTIDEAVSQSSSSPTASSTKDRIIEIRNKIYTSEINNPFVFPLLGINTVGTGHIIGIASAAKALSQGQFGQFPLYAFSSDGVWALEVSATTGALSARQPITRDVCINAKSITQIDSAVLFSTDRGIMLIAGSQTQCITDTVDNNEEPFDFTQFPLYSEIMKMMTFLDESNYPLFPEKKFTTDYLKGCEMLYAYTRQQIIIFNPEYGYAYVYSLESKSWGMIYSNIRSKVNSYPEAYAMTRTSLLVDYSQEDDVCDNQFLITRPIKLDGSLKDINKTIDTIITRGNFEKGHVSTVLYGSRDLKKWFPVYTSKDHYLRHFRGTPYKYFRIALICSLTHDESIWGSSIQYTPKLTNQPR